ncbi:neither inactivation nor afterpotential protein C [Galleria mellonella]|uniref:non-specific serine/threonine protein kinase n=1 Tax=Galleria mellonella TaxID=7137 RepID=A0A6J1WPK4_GALME|nr:neither inactivation nor afterpotential protein C [Galleria mellonella]XP_052757857.1 neither inactivation nor afterpotential protein C [Galleria mellonella]XP_052757858.1 neither inactivation nor afterpotential protein C [Galleria mellonella]
MKECLNISTLPSPLDRYELGTKLGSGIFGDVHKAIDTQAAGKAVAVKIQIHTDDNENHIQEEYKILRDFTKHQNLIDFYGVFCERSEDVKRIWFVLELCECGSVIDIVRKLHAADRKMSEEHIAYILKYTIKAVVYLHENKIIHRNIRCSNILITKDGEVKLSDFGLSCKLKGTHEKSKSNIGSPSWMAPEVVTCDDEGYGNRADVWALGITTIEMADGKGPFQEMHPTRALFQIVRNPPPNLAKPAMWSNDINDFITECLEKNPEHRPYMMELTEHPFIQSVPENDYHLSTELKFLAMDLKQTDAPIKIRERIIKNGVLITEGSHNPEIMQVEDLAALEVLTEDNILAELQTKLVKGSFTSFVGDILLILNPNIKNDIYNEHYHKKYECKSRSDNEPHIFAVADSAYQDALHHNEPQYIVFTGESKSGKTTNMLHALSHLTFLGAMKNNTAERIQKATKIIQAAITAATPININSTRGIFQIQVTYGSSGKLSGAIFWLYQLEKWRVSSTDMSQANFNLLYYFYDAMEAANRLDEFNLEKNRKHRYLRIPEELSKIMNSARESTEHNTNNYKEFVENLKILDWETEDINFLETVMAAILVLGNVRFKDSKNGFAEIENPEEAKKVAKLLCLEEVKFLWALLNYCLIESGTAVKRKHSTDEARDARDTLASALYKRLVDWMINLINSKLSFMRSVFGDKYSVSLLDMFGFECFHRNRLEQLIVNTTNEQIQFLYNQRVFAWEMQEAAEEEVVTASLKFYDNKNSVDQLMGRPMGLFYILDEASRTGSGQEFIMSTIRTTCKGPYIRLSGSHEFSVAHYTGKINYDAREMADKNKDFLPPEMIETLRTSTNITVQQLFRNKLTKTGNLTVSPSQPKVVVERSKSEKEIENMKARKYNTVSRGQFSQVHRMRTAAATYRACSLEILKQLSMGPGSGGTHYARCIRADLNDNPRGFQTEIVRQQLRALAILDTAKARQSGYSCRIPFAEFIRRYRFLAFDFDEIVEETKDNCRLLLIRLKMEGWVLGKTKVFLKYYNEEFLSRLYETQVKKIIKVQCMMRAYLARRKTVKNKAKILHIKEIKKQQSLNVSEDEAALLIQKAYRGYIVRKAYGPLINKSTGQIDEETARFLKRFAMKWKSRSIFQVLLQYRAIRYQDLVHFSQQVHIYNQAVLEALLTTSTSVLLDRVNPQTKECDFLGSGPPTVWKLPFRIDQLQYYDTSYMCDPTAKCTDTFASQYDSDHEQWDEPLKRRFSSAQPEVTVTSTSTQTLMTVPFCRDPTQPVPKLPADEPAKPSVTNQASKDSHYSRPTVYKKKPSHSQAYYQPPEPWIKPRDDTDILEDSAPRLRKTNYSRSLYSIDAPNMENPIKELQALAKSTSDMNDDDPPFNFQAMLKKTPRNRASMKRSGEMDNGITEEKIPQTKIGKGICASKVSPMPSGKTTPVSGKASPAPQRPSSRDLIRKDSKDLIISVLKKRDSKTDLICNIDNNKFENEIVELAPGITVEGTVTDL